MSKVDSFPVFILGYFWHVEFPKYWALNEVSVALELTASAQAVIGFSTLKEIILVCTVPLLIRFRLLHSGYLGWCPLGSFSLTLLPPLTFQAVNLSMSPWSSGGLTVRRK